MNDEVVLHQRNYDGAGFQLNSGTDSFIFLQSTIHGSAPIVIFIHLQNYVHFRVIVKYLTCIANLLYIF